MKNNSSVGVKFVMKPKTTTAKGSKGSNISNIQGKIQTGDKTYDSVCNSYLKQGCSLEVAKQKASEVLKNKNEALANYTKKSSSDAEKQTMNPSTVKSEVHSQAYNQVYESAKRAGASEVQARQAAQEFVDRNKGTKQETVTQTTGKDTENNQGNSGYFITNIQDKFSHSYNVLNTTSQTAIISIKNSNIFLYNPEAIMLTQESIEAQIKEAKTTLDFLSKAIYSVDMYSVEYKQYNSLFTLLNTSINNAETVLEQLNNVGKIVYNTDSNVKGAVDSCKVDMLNIQPHEGSTSVPKEKVAGQLSKESKIDSEGKNTMETGSTRAPTKEKVVEKSTKESQVDSNVTISAVTSKTVCSTVADSNYTTLDTINRLNDAYDPTVAASVQYNADLDKLTDAAIERAKQEAGANATPAEIAYCAYKHLADTAKHVRRTDYNYSPQVNSAYNINEATTAGAWRAASVLDANIGMGACQNYAAATVAVFRKLGFDAKVVGGTGSGTEHFWCQVGNYVFDADVDDERNEIGARFGLTSDEIVAAGRKGYYPEITSGSNGREAVGYNNF